MTDRLYPLRLRPRLENRIWGSRNLQPYFEPRSDSAPALGEAWLTYEQAVVENGVLRGQTLDELIARLGPRLMGDSHRPRAYKRVSADPALARDESPGAYFPILAKLLFTSDVLSVQVHPTDDWALEHAGGPGKTEMWYVVEAEPDARVALGLTAALSQRELAEAARAGEIEQYLNWVRVQPGDAIFVPAGLLHTLGRGLTICEIQQNSDLTYRFWDFNRVGPDGKPRKLHIDEGAVVTNDAPWPGRSPLLPLDGPDLGRTLLAACPYFAAELLSWAGPVTLGSDRERFRILVTLEGEGLLAGEPYAPGTAFLIPAYAEDVKLEARTPTRAVCAYEPDLEALRWDLRKRGASEDAVARAVHD